jgi:outer membrane usher protein FimD/PapC
MVLFFLFPALSRASETIIIEVVLNQVSQGDYFVILTDDGDLLLNINDLRSMGVTPPAGEIIVIEGEEYLSLRSMEGTDFVFDENTLTLKIDLPAASFPSLTIDMAVPRPENVYYPRDSSGFFNYGLNYVGDDSSGLQLFEFTNEVGLRTGDLLFTSDSIYRKEQEEDRFLRLMSTLTLDRREDLRRIMAGDFLTFSGELGSRLSMGGLSFSKNFDIDPYFVFYPAIDFAGAVTTPSEVQVFVDGSLVRTERVPPGRFDIINLTRYEGPGVLELVINDAFGRSRRLRDPFYLTERLLKKGLHQYSYNAGFLREDYFEKSNNYGDLSFSGFHRYGLRDNLTLGISGEASRDLGNMSLGGSYLLGTGGLFDLSLAGSTGGEDRSGVAGLAGFSYLGKKLNARLWTRWFSKDYTTLADLSEEDRRHYELAAGLGYGTENFGSFSVSYALSEKYVGDDQRNLFVTYSRDLTSKSSVFVSYRKDWEEEEGYGFYVNLNYTPWEQTLVSARAEVRDEGNRQALQIQRTPPVGEGYGYWAVLERVEDTEEDITNYSFSPTLEYNSRYGSYRGRLRTGTGGEENLTVYQLSTTGAAAYVGGTLKLSRSVDDSFGLVKVGDLEDVRVYRNNQEIGRTDAKGRVFVPDLLSYYENQISIEDEDIPIEYSLPSVLKYVSPPLRSGSCIIFLARKIQPLVGTLHLEVDGQLIPLEFREVRIFLGGEATPVDTSTTETKTISGPEIAASPDEKPAPVRFTLWPHFTGTGTGLDPGDKAALDFLAGRLEKQRIIGLEIAFHGEEDGLPLARAGAVGEYLASVLDFPPSEVEHTGLAETGDPSMARRMTISLEMADEKTSSALESVPDQSPGDPLWITIPTGRGGEFYLDPNEMYQQLGPVTDGELGCADMERASSSASFPDRLRASVDYQGETYTFYLEIPESDEIYIDLGPVVVNAPQEQSGE